MGKRTEGKLRGPQMWDKGGWRKSTVSEGEQGGPLGTVELGGHTVTCPQE